MLNSFKGAVAVVTGSAVFIWVCLGVYTLKSRDVSLRIVRPKARNRNRVSSRTANRKFIKEPIAGTFGFDFKNHFIDTTDPANKSWWNKNYQKFIEEQEDDKNYRKISHQFLKVKSVDDLKEACSEVYKKKTRENISPISRNVEQEKYENDVWTYCSIEGGVPVTVLENKDSFHGRSKLSNIYASRMISTTSPENRTFWWRHAIAFYGENGSGSKARDETAGFKALYESADKRLDSLRELCEINYNHLYNNENTDIARETLIFCSLSGSSN
ncbi:hypothetical protein MHSWG343_04700 [Candidatus Mycoplasma haematohominis]|uniref:Uncharacterized protein n=1 Tax=Candidatus Mycoplasma haematohominis TaxID=1494318 RepID=A0A478FPY6_9MOLU|nr:hypothetical protein MHSWG343_04700 [Candidatus Mycoplasma haemohominis]